MLRLACTATISRTQLVKSVTSLAQRSGTTIGRPLASSPASRPFVGTAGTLLRGSSMAAAAGTFDNVNVKQASELLKEGQRYVDVRTAEEFAAGHVPGAAHVPVLIKQGGMMAPNPAFLKQFEAEFPDKSAPLCVGCQSGKRSEMASKMLAEAGYTQVTNVEGGFMAWSGANLPTEA
ncbi:hypothetical protein D9Q98_008993 [Chlorella vulgaris]|uniref:Rhodanese domain-containing protein n=1 Tax=Chlorella vulgaris TaxID=3077 RepID=A0A9D4TH21_CHLVU|nr:hypothetical protein D9Q98_008993 [Chlorella vulgaris]